MTSTTAPTNTNPRATRPVATDGHVGLVVLASIATGPATGLLLVLGVFPGADEPHILGSALVGLGVGFTLLVFATTRITSQPQRWSLMPGIGSMVAGLGVVVLAPGQR